MSQTAVHKAAAAANEEADNQLDNLRQLLPGEIFWRNHQPWLEEKGYLLRPRYKPDWTPSWDASDGAYWRYEDGIEIGFDHLLDATRKSDGTIVMLKRIAKSTHPLEIKITQYFSTEPLASHPKNHCVPLYEVLDLPDQADVSILVLPLLRPYDDPRFQTVGEAVDYFRQIFEGLQFMHHCHVAHRDCMNLNIMMDPKPLYPNMYHPQADMMSLDLKRLARHSTRTARPTKYYLIDFGLSHKYRPHNRSPLEPPIWGGDKTVPEFQGSDEPRNPFPTDIYYLGNMIREDFLQKTGGVEFMEDLVKDMVQSDPSKRPTIDEVVARFDQLRANLPWWKLRSRLVQNNELILDRMFRPIGHFLRTVVHMLMLRPAIPSPKP